VTVHGGKIATIATLAPRADASAVADAAGAIVAEGFSGDLDLIGARMFIQERGEPCCSSPEVVARGARIRLAGEPRPAVASLGNILYVPPRIASSGGEDLDAPAGTDFLRLGGKSQASPGAAPLADLRTGIAGGASQPLRPQSRSARARATRSPSARPAL